MIIKEKQGNINDTIIGSRAVDHLLLEWHETNKRILHKHSQSGKEIIIRFLNESQSLNQGDILYIDNESVVVVDITPCEAIVIHPATMQEMASVCYEIGNKHLPLFFQNDELLVPYEAPLFRLLSTSGYSVKREKRKLLNPLRSTVTPHGHNGESLFSKILKLTTASNE